MEPCVNCYSCQADISPRITAEDIKKNNGVIKREWAREEVQERCQSCFTCQSCYSQQADCVSCFTKQR